MSEAPNIPFQERNCLEGKKHSYKFQESWKDDETITPEKGYWVFSMKCEHCEDAYGFNPNDCCYKARDKKHDIRESFYGTDVTSHKTECIKCGIMVSAPVLMDGKRKVAAESVSEIDFKNGLFYGIVNGDQVKIPANNNKRFGNPEISFQVNNNLAPNGEIPVRVEVLDKKAIITRFI